MSETLLAHWEMLIGRWYGPLSLRLVLQPAFAATLALRAGLADARVKRPPFGWTVIRDRHERAWMIRHGWGHVSRLFFGALAVDILYQILVFRRLYPIQGLPVATTLAIPTYTKAQKR